MVGLVCLCKLNYILIAMKIQVGSLNILKDSTELVQNRINACVPLYPGGILDLSEEEGCLEDCRLKN